MERAGIAGVQIAVVAAIHDNGIPNSLLPNPLSTELASQGLTFQPAPPVGYVVTCTNGLTAYLSGDTGQTAEMKVMAEFYHPGLARDQHRRHIYHRTHERGRGHEQPGAAEIGDSVPRKRGRYQWWGGDYGDQDRPVSESDGDARTCAVERPHNA